MQTGQEAPDFTLPDTDNNPVTLSSFRGKESVLLLFFPKAFTSVCTSELCSVRDDIARYNQSKVRVLGISVDDTETLGRFKNENAISFPLLSDSHKKVSVLYDSIYSSPEDPSVWTVSKRSAFLIDKQGVVQYAEVLEDGYQVPDFAAIKAAVERLS